MSGGRRLRVAAITIGRLLAGLVTMLGIGAGQASAHASTPTTARFVTAPEDSPAMTIDDAEFGAKIGKHAGDYGLTKQIQPLAIFCAI